MNQREPRPLPRESLRVLHYVALLLLPVLDATNTNATGRSRSTGQFRAPAPAGSTPYLLALGPPPLRFQEYTPPPDLSTRLPAGAPPPPSGSASLNPPSSDVILPIAETPSLPPPAATKSDVKDTPGRPKKSAPSAIIPDDTRAPVRPEDFLPFFQIPGTAKGPAEVSVVVPIPGSVPPPAPLPPSSATYTQTPR